MFIIIPSQFVNDLGSYSQHFIFFVTYGSNKLECYIIQR
jgi:hypothetical protein